MEGGTNYTCTPSSHWADSSLSLSVPSQYPGHLQVKAEPGPIQGIDHGSGGPYVENTLMQSTFPGHEGAPTVPIEDPGCINHIDLHATYSSYKGDVIPNCTVPSTVTKVSRKKCAAVPSQVTIRPADTQGTPNILYYCDKCNKPYAQPQGVTRHQREAHEKSSCPICNVFKWGRREQLTKHLKEQHPHIKRDVILSDATMCRREATMSKKHLQQQQASPAIECDRRAHGELLPSPLMHTLRAAAKGPHVSHPIAYHPYARRAMPCKREDAGDLGLFDPTTNALSACSYTEEHPKPVNGVGISVHHRQNCSSPTLAGGSTSTNRPTSFIAVPSLGQHNYLLSQGTGFIPRASTGPGLIRDIDAYRLRQPLLVFRR